MKCHFRDCVAFRSGGRAGYIVNCRQLNKSDKALKNRQLLVLSFLTVRDRAFSYSVNF